MQERGWEGVQWRLMEKHRQRKGGCDPQAEAVVYLPCESNSALIFWISPHSSLSINNLFFLNVERKISSWAMNPFIIFGIFSSSKWYLMLIPNNFYWPTKSRFHSVIFVLQPCKQLGTFYYQFILLNSDWRASKTSCETEMRRETAHCCSSWSKDMMSVSAGHH